MKKYLTIVLCFFSWNVFCQENEQQIIDIHLHAYNQINPNMAASWAGEDYARALLSPTDAQQHHELVLKQLEKNNIKLALVSSTALDSI